MIHIRDPVHDHISFEEKSTVHRLVDTREFQRLRGLRQLGVSSMVYPGAEHSRFSHALGVAHLSGRMYDYLTERDGDPDEREKLIIAGLLHDIGHTPFSHLFERYFTPDVGHEEWGRRIILDGETQVNEILKSNYEVREIADLLAQQPSKPRFLHMIVSSQLDADRFDYLLRDAYHTGVPEGQYDLERILRNISTDGDERLVVKRKGRYSVEGYLTSRYHMYNQVYLHRTTLCIEYLLKKILLRVVHLVENDEEIDCNLFRDATLSRDMELSVGQFLSATDWTLLDALNQWRNCEDQPLKDLCTRFLSRRRIFKPLKNVEPDFTKMFSRKEQIEGVLQAYGLDPRFYYTLVADQVKEAYKPYGPQKEDQENAILLDTGEEISKSIPNLQYLRIGPNPFLCIPEETREDIAELFT